jgi:hypothetical protein
VEDYPDVACRADELAAIRERVNTDPHTLLRWGATSRYVDWLTRRLLVPAVSLCNYLKEKGFGGGDAPNPGSRRRAAWMRKWQALADPGQGRPLSV